MTTAQLVLQRWRQFVTVFVTFLMTASAIGMAQGSAPYSITGRTINASTGAPLAHTTVSLEQADDSGTITSVTSDENGTFRFLQLRAGRYILRGSHRGFLTTAYDAHDSFTTVLVTGERQHCCEDIQLRLVPEGVISGTVAEDSGDPVERGRITLYRESNHTGSELIQRVRASNVDEGGAYEFSGLEPGNYFISVSATPWYVLQSRFIHFNPQQPGTPGASDDAPLDLVYATTFYAETTDADSATPIPIKGGDRIKIDFALHPVPAVHLRLHMSLPMAMPQIEQQVFGQPEVIPVMPIANNGEIELSIPPGQFDVHIPGHNGEPGKQFSLHATADQSIDTVSSTGTPMADVTGKFALSSGTSLPEEAVVTLETPEGHQVRGAIVDKDGTSVIHNVPPGIYRLQIAADGKPLHILKIAATGAVVEHRQITVGNSSVTLAATLYPELGLAISGFTKRNGSAVAGAMVVLIPENPASNRDYFRRAQSASDGSFVMKDVEPGKYTIVAIQDGWALDWAQPAVMQHFLAQGQAIAVTAQGPQTIQMSETVEAQEK